MTLPHHFALLMLLIIAHHEVLLKHIRMTNVIEVKELEDRARLCLSDDLNK